MVNAVILSGGRDERLAGFYDGPSKGLVNVCGKPCVEYVLEAVRATPGVGRIALIGPREVQSLPVAAAADTWLDTPGGIVASLCAAVEALGHERQVLFVCGDSPLVTPDSLSEVIERCPDDCALFYPIVTREQAVAEFPARNWIFAALRDADIVASNFMVISPALLTKLPRLATAVERARRSPWRLAALWGWWFFLKYALGILSIADCERRVSALAGEGCRGTLSTHPEIALDLDYPEDLPIIERAMQWLPGWSPNVAISVVAAE